MPEQSRKEELDQLRLERERLELEQLRHEVAELQSKRERKAMAHSQVEHDLKDFEDNQRRRQENCNHRKGGKNLEGVQGRGTDPMYAVIQHQLPFGDWIVICQRCQKIWKKGDADYKEAINFQTDNSPSGPTLFLITKTAPEEKVANA